MATRAHAPLALKRCYVTSYQRTENRPQRRPRFIFSYALSFRVLVGLGGLEPPTSPLSGVRSNHLSYRPKISGSRVGGASRDRTDDPLLAKQVLSQLSYGPSFNWGQTTISIPKTRIARMEKEIVVCPQLKLVGLGRLELPTSPLSGVRSNHLSYRPETRYK